jgi:transcriptional regulator with XRE-family HTH domain
VLRGWTTRDLSEASGVSQATVSKVERGAVAPRPETARLLAEALGLAIADLYEDEVAA